MPQAIWNIPPAKERIAPLTRMTLPQYEAYILEQRNLSRRKSGLLPFSRHLLLTFRVFLRGWWIFLVVSAVIIFGSRSILSILQGVLRTSANTSIEDILRFVPSSNLLPDVQYTIPTFTNTHGLWLAVGLFGTLLIVQLWGVATIIGILTALPGRNVSEAIGQTTSRLISYLLLAVINLITVIGGLFLLVLPGIVVAVWFLFSPFVHLVEAEGIGSSFTKSRQLVQGYGFAVFWRVVFLVVIIVALNGLLVHWGLVHDILPVFLLPLNVIFLFLLYQNLRLIKRDLTPEETPELQSALGTVETAKTIRES